MVKSLTLFSPARKLAVPTEKDSRRGSRHERGYDYQWTKAAAAFTKQHPICQECDRHGRTIPARVVDHKIPVKARPDLRMDRRNWWSLCDDCHNGMKRRMEAYALKLGTPEILLQWCDEPKSRPAAFQTVRKSRVKGMVV